jgi:OOP family OmpA-OmpF porin
VGFYLLQIQKVKEKFYKGIIMNKKLVGIGIISALILSGCGSQSRFSSGGLATSVSQLMKDEKVVGWVDYEKDKDKDGVKDYLDKCPNTPQDAKVDEKGCAVDSDEDGVKDYLDKCPDTPKDLEVDKYGCVLDDDNDSVANYMDKCPNTPKNVEVDEKGCAIDSDKDGVKDYLDKCPDTPKDLEVDKKGCPILKTYMFNFKFNSYEIDKKYYSEIKKMANILKADKNIRIEIQGHTDNLGSEKYNKELSLQRANALKNILVSEFKIDAKRIKAVGLGTKKPMKSNETEEGRAKNRRVVVVKNITK